MERDLQWDFFDYLPVVLQDASTRDVLMVQYMTEEGLARTLDEASMWLWSRSREQFWMAGRNGGGYDLRAMRANCMGDSLLAVVDATDRGVCHLGNRNLLLAAGRRRDLSKPRRDRASRRIDTERDQPTPAGFDSTHGYPGGRLTTTRLPTDA